MIDEHLIGPLMLLVKLNVVGVRKVSYSYAYMMLHNAPPPPCSIKYATVNFSQGYFQFVVKRKHPGEDWMF